MTIRIDEPGLASSVQDLGRPGHYNVGIPRGGALDTVACRLANLLVGNPDRAAVIETAYTGPRFVATVPTVMAVTGAVADVAVNGSAVDQWCSIELAAGDEVSIGFASSGARGYVALRGGVDVPEVLGARGTYALGRLGGFDGRVLAAGDEIPIGDDVAAPAERRRLDEALRPSYGRAVESRVVLGLYDHLLTGAAHETLTSAQWTLTHVADRTGLRFRGPDLAFRERTQPFGAGSDPSNIVDAGYPVGSIQVPGGKEPIVLHRDAVSAGGYAMVGTVISSDLDAMAQLSPGSTTTFVPVTVDQACAARAHRREQFAAMAASITG